MSASPYALSLTDAGSVAGIAGAAVAVVLFIVGALRPTRKFLSRWRIFESWILTKNERKQIQIEIAQADAAKRADLQFELRLNGGIKLVTHNKGLCSAQNVVIRGELSPRYYADYPEAKDYHGRVVSYRTIPPGGSRSESVSNVVYQIDNGGMQWSLRVNWDDEAGQHRDKAGAATRWE